MTDKKAISTEQAQAEARQAQRDHIERCIKEYNDAEAIQERRLTELFYELKKRNGYRRVRFSSGSLWSNFWSGDEHLDKRRYLDQFSRIILEAEIGED